MRLSKVQVVASSVLILSFLVSSLSLTRATELRPNATLREMLYVQSPDTVRRFGLGYTGLMAAIYWTRAIQYFGRQRAQNSTDLQLLYPLLHITTELDPKMIVAYEFGSTFIAAKPPWGAGEPERAIALVRRGIERNPDSWRLYYQLGFLQYMERKDYAAAAKAFEEGSRLPNAHPWLKIMAARMTQEAGSLDTAELMWRSIAETTTDQKVRENALLRLVALRVEREIALLQQQIDKYMAATGKTPTSMQELVSAGYLRYVPTDPSNAPYGIWNGKAIVETPEWWKFITHGIPDRDYDEHYLRKKGLKP